MAGIGSLKVKQICLCAWDLEKSEKAWTKVLGISPRKQVTPVFSEVPTFTDNKPDSFGPQEFLVYELEDDVHLEIFGPGTGENPWKTFLEKHGEGVMNVAFYVPDRASAYKVIGEVCEAKNPYHEGFYPGGTYTFVDTMKELQMELNIKKDEDNEDLEDNALIMESNWIVRYYQSRTEPSEVAEV